MPFQSLLPIEPNLQQEFEFHINYWHTLFYCTLLHCASHLFRILHIEGKAFQQQKDSSSLFCSCLELNPQYLLGLSVLRSPVTLGKQ